MFNEIGDRLVEDKASSQIYELVQLNQWGPYSYNRDELVQLLDEAFAGDAATE